MRSKLNIHVDTTVLAIAMWFCLLPVIALLILPLFGRATAIYVSAILFPLWLTVCWGICGWYIIKNWFD